MIEEIEQYNKYISQLDKEIDSKKSKDFIGWGAALQVILLVSHPTKPIIYHTKEEEKIGINTSLKFINNWLPYLKNFTEENKEMPNKLCDFFEKEIKLLGDLESKVKTWEEALTGDDKKQLTGAKSGVYYSLQKLITLKKIYDKLRAGSDKSQPARRYLFNEALSELEDISLNV